jgi:hypothetical protein
VIKFKCIYCGQRILAKDGSIGKQGKCPKCAHLLNIPKSTKGKPAISFDKEPMPEQHKRPPIPEWKRAVEWPADKVSDEQDDELIDLCKESFGFLIPTYDKFSLLLLALTFILLYMTTSHIRLFIPNANETSQTETFANIAKYDLFLLFPLILALKIFVKEEYTDLKKKIMVSFAILINTYSGILSGIYILSCTASAGWLVIFPIWNIINCLLMLLMFFTEIIDEDCISDRKATPLRILFGFIAILTIFVLCTCVLKLYWPVTFSICTIYITSFDRALQNVFPGLTRQEAEVEP